MGDDTTLIPVSLRVPADMLESIDKVAKSVERPRSWVILRALRFYLADEGQEFLDIQEGIDELDRGEGIPSEQVWAELEAMIAAMRARRAAE